MDTEKNERLAYITSGLSIILLLFLLWFPYYCGNKPNTSVNYTDSLAIQQAKINELEKQLGYTLNDVSRANDARMKAEMKSHERDTIYLTRTRTIFKEAPDTCQPYLTAIVQECDTLVLSKEKVISELKVESAEKDTAITQQGQIIDAQSKQVGILKDANDSLAVDNKKLERKVKFNRALAKIGGWAVVTTGVVLAVLNWGE